MAGNGGWRRLLRAMGVEFYPGEAPVALVLFAAFFLCVTFQYASKTVRQSTFVDGLGAARLPWVYLAVAVLSYPVLRLYLGLAGRMAIHRLLVVTYGAVAASLVLFWWLFGHAGAWVPLVFYVWISIALALTLSQLWSFANRLFDPRQAKRLFGFLGAGALLGGVAGGQLARLASGLAGTRSSLLVAAVPLLGVAALVVVVRRLQPEADPLPAAGPPRRPGHTARSGLAEIRASRHLRLVAALMAVGVVVAQVVDLQFNWAVEASTRGLDHRTAFFGNFFSLMGLTACFFQFLFTSRIHRFLGAGFAIRVLPLTLAFGTTGLVVAAAAFPRAVIAAALSLKVADSGLRYSLDDSSRELLFLPLHPGRRLAAKTFIDVAVKRGAKGLAALLLLPVTFGLMHPMQAGWVSLALCIVWFALTFPMAREYVRSFRHSLERKTVEAAPLSLSDVTTLEILVQSLGSANPRQVAHGIELLSAHGRSHLVPPLLLHHEDAEVRQRTLEALAEAERRDAAPLVERSLGDADPEVRATAVKALAALRHEDAGTMMLPRLVEGHPAVRAAAIACLGNHGDEEMRRRARTALGELASDASPEVRAEAARSVGSVFEPLFTEELVGLLGDAEVSVVRTAVEAVRRRVGRDGANPLYLPRLVSLLQSRRLKHDAREALAAFGEPAIPALVYFMNDPGEPIWVRRALPKTIARIGTPAALAALLDGLETQHDSFLRQKLIEALVAVKPTAGIGRAAGRVEREVRREAESFLTVLARLWGLDPRAAAAADGADGLEEERAVSLLERLLRERLDDHRRNLFGLLGLIHHRAPIRDAFGALVGGHPPLRAHALEYLDNALTGETRRLVLAAVGDSPVSEKLELAGRLFGVTPQGRAETVRELLGEPNGDSDAPFLTAAALYLVHTEGISELHTEVARLQHSAEDPFVRETAGWVARRHALPAAP